MFILCNDSRLLRVFYKVNVDFEFSQLIDSSIGKYATFDSYSKNINNTYFALIFKSLIVF